jgi:hypothetical protein
MFAFAVAIRGKADIAFRAASVCFLPFWCECEYQPLGSDLLLRLNANQKPSPEKKLGRIFH